MSDSMHILAGRRVALGLVATCLAAAVWSGHARADGEAHSQWKGFHARGEYVVQIGDDELQPKDLLQIPRLASFLILSDEVDDAILIQVRGKTVQRLDKKYTVRRKDDNVYLLADTEFESVGTFTLQGAVITFALDGKSVRIKPNPPLTGLHKAEEVLEHSPQYERSKPKNIDLGRLEEVAKEKQPIQVVVYFGSWCPSCKRYVPSILGVDDKLEDAGVKFTYYGLPKPPQAWKDATLVEAGVKKLPTGIVTRNGRELGRIIGNDWRTPVRCLEAVLRKSD